MKLVLWVLGLGASLGWGQLIGNDAPRAPAFNPESQSFTESLKVKLTCSGSNRVYFTVDSTDPGVNTGGRNSPVELTLIQTTMVKAMCVEEGNLLSGSQSSEIITEVYTLERVPTPSIIPAGGYYTGNVSVVISTDLSGSTLHYTLNGSEPTQSSPVAISGAAITVAPTATLKVFASKAGWANSLTASETYIKKETVATPKASPGDTTFTEPLNVTLTSTAGADIYYTDDGTNPKTSGTSKFYSKAIAVAGKTTTIRAYALKANMTTSELLTAAYTYVPKAPLPSANPTGISFFDTLLVKLENSLPGTEIRYTLNGTDPSATSALYSEGSPIRLDSTRKLSARSFAPKEIGGVKYLASDLYQQNYQLKLSPPLAFPSNAGVYEYKDSLKVVLSSLNAKATLLYTLNGTNPTSRSTLIRSGDSISLGAKDTTVLKAMAITQDTTIKSAIATWTYVKVPTPKLPAPQATPPSRKFTGTLAVTLSEFDGDATIYYTTDGSAPDQATAKVGGKTPFGLILNATTTLKMRAYKDGALPSEISEERYTLQPATPTANPPAGTVTPGTKVTLASITPGAEVWYTLGDSLFSFAKAAKMSAGGTIEINADTRIQAKALLITDLSQEESVGLLDARYYLNHIKDDSLLGPGGIASNDYRLELGESTGSGAMVRFAAAPTGLGDIALQPVVIISSPPGGNPIDVLLSPVKPGGLALYRIEGKSLRFISKTFPARIQEPGTYVLGKDTLGPRLKWLSQTVSLSDSTEVRLEFTDEIVNPFFQIQANYSAGWSKPVTLSGSRDTLVLRFKNPPATTGDLWFKIKVGDWMQSAFFPADSGNRFVLSQGFNSLKTRGDLRLGEAGYKWDLVGFPSSVKTPLTLRRIAEDNPAYLFKAYAWNSLNSLQEIPAEAPLMPGNGLWLATNNPVRSLNLSRFLTAPSDSDGHFRIDLHAGWNLIANPSLNTLWWPVSREQSNYGSSQIRGLCAFDSEIADYSPSDSLEAWRGYFVYNRGPDSSITLLTSPPSAPLAKSTQAPIGPLGWQIVLAEGKRMPVVLGAYSGALPGIGPEDEGLPPKVGLVPMRLHALRNGRALQGDFLAPVEKGWASFSLRYGPSESQAGESLVPEIRVLSRNLPEGYQAWAWLPKRGLRQPLHEGTSLAHWSASSDSLQILVGAAQDLERVPGFALAKLAPGDFSCRVQPSPQGWQVHITLPQANRIDALWIRTDGKQRALIKNRLLGPGRHILEMNPPKNGLIRLRGQNPENGEFWVRLLRN